MFKTWGRVSLFVLLASCCVLSVAAEKKSTRSSKASSARAKSVASKGVTIEKASKLSGRLPRHFASLVDEEQRVEIYQIQVSYREKIMELEAALAELESEQLEEIEKVLTSTQRKKLSEIRKGAGKGSSSKSASKSKSSSTKKTPAKTASTTKSRKKASTK